MNTPTKPATAELPAIMWVVTRERTRAGKPPLKISPFDYAWSANGKYSAVKAGKQRGEGEKIYWLADCHPSLDDARKAMEKLIAAELHNEQEKLNNLTRKMRAAKKSAAALVA